MKKLLFLCGCLLLLLATSCRRSSGYTIQGESHTLPEGDSIFLVQFDGVSPHVWAKTTIHQGKFQFQSDTIPEEGLFYLSAANGQFPVPLLLEPGTLQVLLDTIPTLVRGTAHNEMFSRYCQSYQNRMRALYRDYEQALAQGSSLTEQEQQLCARTFDLRSRELLQEMAQTIREQQDNIVGEKLFLLFFPSMDDSLQAAMVKTIPATWQQKPTFQPLLQRVNARLQTAVGQPYTDLTLKTPNGDPQKLSHYLKGQKLLLVDFWASWCGPCRAEMPTLVKAYATYKDKGLQIVGISLDDKAEDWNKAIAGLHLTWPQLSDLRGWQSEAARRYAIDGIPATVLINQQGEIIHRDLRGEALLQTLETLLR